jgi:hypothetical protein
LLPLLLLAATACGVRFGAPDPETELFADLELTGDRVPNGDLTLTVTVTQGYPVPVRIACYYDLADRDLTDDEENVAFENRAPQIGETVLPAAPPGTSPGDDDLPKTQIEFNFSLTQPGLYNLVCLTPGAAENGIVMTARISAR